MSEIRVRNKVWLEIDGQPLLGDGRARLLRAIAATGSINAACQELDISYRKAWAQLQEMERLAPFPILERNKGGKGGGGAKLTMETQALLIKFAELRNMVTDQLTDCRQLDFSLSTLEIEQ
ncbi:MAG: LysR family transcriptional regulator [Thermodesulfobacteriota bacterium]|nr:LysR family transcriptional regulator [Thermodesulfobacteriota bacterium]